MNATVALFHAPGQPFELRRVVVPTLGEDELLVRVACSTLCSSDLHTHAGRRTEPTPMVLGHEIVGRIEAFGPVAKPHDFRGQPLAVGDRVSWSVAASCGDCFFCADALPQKCESLFKYGHERLSDAKPLSGGLAEYVVLARATSLFRVPDSLPDELAAIGNCTTATCAAVLRAAGDLAGRSVLILGAGMLGLTACAMARTAGAGVVAVCDPDGARRERALGFGATHALSDASEIAALTSGRGPDVALELAGGADAVRAGLSHVRVGGTLVLAGTVLPTPSVSLDPERVVRRMLTIRGVHNYAPRDLGEALDFLAGPGKQYPFAGLIAKTFRLAEVDAAFAFAHAHPGCRVAVIP